MLAKTCTIENCTKLVVARGWCRRHYSRWHRRGDPRKLQGYFSKHGQARTPEYRAWLGMKSRCYRPNTNRYEDYGGRGIKVCERWLHDFVAFYKDIGPRPSPQHSIDRIDPDGDYEPNNVRWGTKRQQSINQRSRMGASDFRGVSWDSSREIWVAHISVNNRSIHIARASDECTAAWMYDQWAIALHGEDAKLNFTYEVAV